jgi:hypothetical protein
MTRTATVAAVGTILSLARLLARPTPETCPSGTGQERIRGAASKLCNITFFSLQAVLALLKEPSRDPKGFAESRNGLILCLLARTRLNITDLFLENL